MVKQFTKWLQLRLANTEMVMLILSIIVIVIIIALMGKLLAPVLVSIVFAYLMDGMVNRLERWHVPHLLAVSIICLLLISILLLAILVLLPLLWEQLTTLINDLPNKVKQGEALFNDLSQRYPAYISKEQVQSLMSTFQADFAKMGRVLLSFSIATLSSVMMIIIYLVLVPLMVFFFLKDKREILIWFGQLLPKKRQLIVDVWSEVNQQIGNYIRAKVLEMLVVGVITTIVFAVLGLNYSILLGVLVGLSTLIPYVGVILVTIPVVIIGYLQWGLNAYFIYLLIIYLVLMIIDGNVLAPLLFSETLKIHPIAVIIAVLIFGGLWGFWGVFFAIPLATVVKAVLNAWFHSERAISAEYYNSNSL